MSNARYTLLAILFATLSVGVQAQSTGNTAASMGNVNREMGNGNLDHNIHVDGQTDYGIDPDVIEIDVDDPIDIRPYDDGNGGDVDVIIEEVVIKKSYNAVFTLTKKGKTATAAESSMNSLLRSLKSQMSRLGISSSEVNAEFISLVPVYEIVNDNTYQQGNEKKHTGFELKQKVRIHFVDYDLLKSIIQRAAAIGIDQLDKVEHIIEREKN